MGWKGVFVVLGSLVSAAGAFLCKPNQVHIDSKRPDRLCCLGINAILRPINGVDDIPLDGESPVNLEGKCMIERRSGRYYCVDETGSGTAIGRNKLTSGVSYGLSDGMIIRTSSGMGYEVKFDGESLPADPTMGLMFNAMKAQFGINDNDAAASS
jgi:hypothetical protein